MVMVESREQRRVRAVGELIPAREQRIGRLWLLAVAVAVAAAHLAVAGVSRPLGWDEAVLLTQVIPDVPAVFMEPHRTRGVSFLMAPIAIFDPSMVVMRTYLVVAGAIGLFAAFATWIRSIGGAAVVAAALFAFHWVTVVYAVEALPNLPAALLAVACAGLTAEVLLTGSVRRHVPLVLAGLYAAFVFVRPPDAVITGLTMAVLVIALRPRLAARVLVPSAVAGLAALGVWFVEGAMRFGFTPWQTVRSASEYSIDGERFNQLPLYIASLGDRLRCAGSCLDDFVAAGQPWQLPPPRTSMLVVAVLVAIAVAVLAGRDSRRLAATVVGLSVAIVAFYSFTGGAMNLRYLMPAFASAAIGAAIGCRVLWQVLPRERAGQLARGALLVPLIAVLVWQASDGIEVLREHSGARYRAAELAAALEPHIDDGPCAVGTVVNFPQIQYWTRCPSTRIVAGASGEIQDPLGERNSYVNLAAAAEEGADVFAITRPGLPDEHPTADWDLIEAQVIADGEEFQIYRHVPGARLPPPPCPDGEAERLIGEVLSEDCPG